MEGGWLVGNGGELLAGTGGGGAGGLESIYRLRRRRAFAITLDKKIFFVMQHAGIELGPHRYDATLHSLVISGVVLSLVHCVMPMTLSCWLHVPQL